MRNYDELVKRLRYYEEHGLCVIDPYEAGEAADAIEELLPSAQCKGKWIDSYDLQGNHYKRCSECGAYIETTFFANDYSVNFCPNCGASMQKDGEA